MSKPVGDGIGQVAPAPPPLSEAAWRLPQPLRIAQGDEQVPLASLLGQLTCFPAGGGVAAVLPLLSSPATRIVVVGPKGVPEAAAVVHLVARPGGLRVIVDELVVDARQRGRGLGRTLLGGLTSWSDSLGADMLARVDPDADGLYAASGFGAGGDAFYERPHG